MSMGRSRTSLAATALLLVTAACNGDDASSPAPKPTVGLVLVRVATSGTDPDDRYDVSIGTDHRTITASGYVTFTVTPGSMVVKLEGVAQNCVINGEDTRAVTVDAGQTVTVDFAVGCLATGLSVSTHTTGSDFPDYYVVSIGGFNQRTVGTNTEFSFSRLNPGSYTASLILPGENCAVVSPREVTAVVTNRQMTPVKFDVECTTPTRLEKIAFIDDSLSNVHRLFLARPDGSDQKYLGAGESPAWSPDGSYVAYTLQDCDYYYYYYGSACGRSLFITDPEIGRTRKIAISVGLNVGAPAWSPAGGVIAFINIDQHTLYLISSGGGTPILVSIAPARWAGDPSWSPDGKRIAFSCIVDESNVDVCIVGQDGTGFTRLTTGTFNEFDPAWSPDGNTIAFVTNPSGVYEIATMAPDGSGVQKLTDGFSPSWTRGGAAIAFSRDLGTFTIKPDGSGLTKITSGKQRDIVWRP